MSPPIIRRLPPTWKYAVVGAVASVPIIGVLNVLPDRIVQTDLGAGIMIIGGFIAGTLAAASSVAPGEAGLLTGLFAAVAESLVFIPTMATTVTWSLSRVVFWFVTGGFVVFGSALFGYLFGRIGGWVANTVDSYRSASVGTHQS